MREHSLLRLFHFILAYPVAALTTVGFAVLHHRLANRFGCFGFFKNLLYGLACAAASVGLFFVVVLLVRFTGLSARLLVQVLGGFAFGAFLIVINRLVFAQKPPTSVRASRDGDAV